MKKILGLTLCAVCLFSCSGRVSCGYMLDAEGEANWNSKEECKVDD